MSKFWKVINIAMLTLDLGLLKVNAYLFLTNSLSTFNLYTASLLFISFIFLLVVTVTYWD
jgi:hypothetical protein